MVIGAIFVPGGPMSSGISNAEKARVRADWLVRVPDGLTLRQTITSFGTFLAPRLVDRGQRDVVQRGERRVVEADDRNLVGPLQSRRLHRTPWSTAFILCGLVTLFAPAPVGCLVAVDVFD